MKLLGSFCQLQIFSFKVRGAYLILAVNKMFFLTYLSPIEETYLMRFDCDRMAFVYPPHFQ